MHKVDDTAWLLVRHYRRNPSSGDGGSGGPTTTLRRPPYACVTPDDGLRR